VRQGGEAAVADCKTLKPKTIAGGAAAGLVASVCCGGSVVFASVGLGAFSSTLGLGRYIPEALVVGALSIVLLNYIVFSRHARAGDATGGAGRRMWRAAMLESGAVGLAVMVASFVFLEWLNHAVIHAHRFASHPEYRDAWLRGVPNAHLALAVSSMAGALMLLAALPLPPGAGTQDRYGPKPEAKSLG
jgi:hypothetical protein